MKKRLIVCLFISIYLIYTHKNRLLINLKEFPYLSNLYLGFSDLYNTSGKFHDMPEYTPKAQQKNYSPYEKKIIDAGFQFEEHKILTEDGYILTAWRIPGLLHEKKTSNKHNQKRRPVMLQHGLFDSSYTWLMLNSTESLAFLLAREGYDVWMTNSRGNVFSTEHIHPDHDSNIFYSKFWDFTFHEMAMYDLPANVFYIKNITGWEKIYYVGHSQGSVQYFIKYTQNPEFIEENIEKFVAIGTVVNVFNTTSKIVHLLHHTGAMILMEKILVKNLFVFNNFMYDSLAYFCKKFVFVCKPVVQFFTEDDATNRIDYNKLFENFQYTPGGTSARNVNHWIQFYTTKEFTQFDFGTEMNFIQYGQYSPPSYDLTKFRKYKVKSMMTTSDSDPFSKIDDCKEHLFKYINPTYLKIKNLKNYNHLDYLWSSDAVNDIYKDVVDFLK